MINIQEALSRESEVRWSVHAGFGSHNNTPADSLRTPVTLGGAVEKFKIERQEHARDRLCAHDIAQRGLWGRRISQ